MTDARSVGHVTVKGSTVTLRLTGRAVTEEEKVTVVYTVPGTATAARSRIQMGIPPPPSAPRQPRMRCRTTRCRQGFPLRQ